MSSSQSRPRRYLAAWGYESGRTDTRVEIDVWAVNRVERDDDLAEARRRLVDNGPFEAVIRASGNVAEAVYPGAAGEGYVYVDSGEKASKQAFAGASRAAGADFDPETGRFGEGWREPPDAPDLAAVVAHGEQKVIPAVARDLDDSGAYELADEVRSIPRDSSRDEDGEPTTGSAFTGFRNAVRIYPRAGSPYEYEVDVGREAMK